MSPQKRYLWAKIICPYFPLIVSQALRTRIFGPKHARVLAKNFVKKSVTGSLFNGNTSDYHAYTFSIHGFFDWMNVIVAYVTMKYFPGEIIEVGANIGTETLCFSDIAKGKVYAFEPSPKVYQELTKVASEKENIELYPIGISDKNGTAIFSVAPNSTSGCGKVNPENSSIEGYENIEIEIDSLDNVLGDRNGISLIVIDAEGHEPFILRGSKRVIENNRPILVLEINTSLLRNYANTTPFEILENLVNMNYCSYRLTKYGLKNITTDYLSKKISENWICIPDEKKKLKGKLHWVLIVRSFIPWFVLRKIKS